MNVKFGWLPFNPGGLLIPIPPSARILQDNDSDALLDNNSRDLTDNG